MVSCIFCKGCATKTTSGALPDYNIVFDNLELDQMLTLFTTLSDIDRTLDAELDVLGYGFLSEL
jgi:hypothetical protein